MFETGAWIKFEVNLKETFDHVNTGEEMCHGKVENAYNILNIHNIGMTNMKILKSTQNLIPQILINF